MFPLTKLGKAQLTINLRTFDWITIEYDFSVFSGYKSAVGWVCLGAE